VGQFKLLYIVAQIEQVVDVVIAIDQTRLLVWINVEAFGASVFQYNALLCEINRNDSR
jgi:hypothetical protein